MTGVLDERGQEYTPPNRGKSVAEQAWDLLDQQLDELVRIKAQAEKPGLPGGPRQIGEVTGWCQALAWTIHTWTPHWYKTVDDVTRQAVKRRQMRLGEIEFEPTPGYQYNPMPVSHREYARINKQAFTPKEVQPAEKPAPKPKALGADVIETIKQGLANGFTVEDLSRMLKVPENVVKSYA